MKAKALLVPLLLILGFGIAACGGSEDTTSETGSATEATEPEPESQEDSDAPAQGGGSTESESAPSGEARKAEKVEILEFTYVPDPVVVQVGGKVTWQNEDTAPHTATADDGSFDTGMIDKGKIGSETFKQPGTFTYFCTVHPEMHGTVEVVE
ncbi:MAG TPA: cupredoxin family copper-binding protein [Solirubrobacterales bacterium]|nr:cupredoxin family copper-binding protein [Solirubrobacterales bacterium]